RAALHQLHLPRGYLAQLQPWVVGDEEVVQVLVEGHLAAVPVVQGELRVARRLEDDALSRDLGDLHARRERDERPLGVVGVGDLRLVVMQVTAQVEGFADAGVRDRPRAPRAGRDQRGREDTETDQGGASHATRLAKWQ